MKKKLISMVLLVCMLCTLFPAPVIAAATEDVGTTKAAEQPQTVSENPFKDIKGSDWFYDAAQYARENGFFNGTTDTTFDPNGTMTRGMFVTVLGRMAGVKAEKYKGKTGFSDVPEDQYYAPYVKWADQYKITGGTGNGKFSPNDLIDRQQMATLLVRYFEAFGVDYETDANITSIPADIDSVSPYARDAVMKLWKNGLMNGDGKNFNPADKASRAQAAGVCMRIDKSVETWYSEPGVISERESVDPLNPVEPVDPVDPAEPVVDPVAPPAGGGSSGGGSKTTYCEVRFALGEGISGEGITMPATATYAEGTAISTLPTPRQSGTIFLGWYYDKSMETPVLTDDLVGQNMTLYAKIAEGEAVTSLETPNYVTVTDQPVAFTFKVKGATDADEAALRSALELIAVSEGNTVMDYNVSAQGNGTFTVSADFEEGQTYQAGLTGDEIVFVIEDEEQDESIKYLNILIAKGEVAHVALNKSMAYISASDVTGLDEDAYGGLVESDVSLQTVTENTTTGTFTYAGDDLAVGDTVSIYNGKRPDQRHLLEAGDDDDPVAYVKIIAVSGNTYTYEMADVNDVLMMPDVIPLEGVFAESFTASVGDVNAALAYTLNTEATVDEGDFIAFYEDAGGDHQCTAESEITRYGRIKTVQVTEGTYSFVCTLATAEEVDSTLDVFYSDEPEIEVSESEAANLESEIRDQFMASGYYEAVALYLEDLAYATDGFQTVDPSLPELSESAQLAEGHKVEVDIDPAEIVVQILNKKLDHLDAKGLDVTVNVPFAVTIDEKIEIAITAAFEQEVILKQNINTKRMRLGFLKYDYVVETSFDVGTYTGISFSATVAAAGEEDEDEKILGKKLNTILTIIQAQVDGGGVNSGDGSIGSLADTYASLMEGAGDTWFPIIEKKIFELNGSAFLHILCWKIGADFVVSANVNASVGMNFSYVSQKRHCFSIQLKSNTSTNNTIDVIETQYNFDFYVIGTLGIRAGIKLEVAVGLISLKIDSIGVEAEAGVYAQMWGYFYYHLQRLPGGDKEQKSSGALLIEIGAYLDVNFKAQLFSCKKLTYNPSLYSNQWPILTLGDPKNVFGFTNPDDESYTLQAVKTLALPGTTFTMDTMNLKDGEVEETGWDDMYEDHFTISFSDRDLLWYDPHINTIFIRPAPGATSASGEVTFTWKSAALAFTSKPIQKTIHINWSNPEAVRYISFDSQGGTAVNAIYAGIDARITWPANPSKTGYTFGGWYKEAACETPYSAVATMPSFGSEKGLTLYAKWTPAVVNYTVEHWKQNMSGVYVLDVNDTEKKQGIAGAQTASVAKNYTGFHALTPAQAKIRADGTTTVKVFYDRQLYTITFTYGERSTADRKPITQTYRYEASINPPVLTVPGYEMTGWKDFTESTSTATGNATFAAQWMPLKNTVTFNSQGGSAVTTQMVDTDSKITRPADPTRANFAFGGWYKNASCTAVWDFNTPVSGPVTLYAKWTAIPASYTVNHYQQNLAGDGYELISGDTQSVSAFVGHQTVAVAKTYPGFTAKSFEQKTIAAGSSTVVDIYYDRNSYALTVNNPDGVGTDKTSSGTYKFGATVTIVTGTGLGLISVTAMQGTTPVTITNNTFQMPAGDVTVTVTFTPQEKNYKVRHIKQNLDGTYDDPYFTQTQLYGIEGQQTKAVARDEVGFTAKPFEQKTIASDGSTVVDIYYDRNSYDLTVINPEGEGADKTVSGTRKYGETVTINPGTKAGYTAKFDCKRTASGDQVVNQAVGQFNMPPEAVTVTVSWRGNYTAYTVKHWLLNVDGSCPATPDVTDETLKGTVGTETKAVAKTYTGFTAQTVEQQTIAGVGTTVVNIYYERNSYNMTVNNADGTGEGITVTGKHKYGETVTVNPGTKLYYSPTITVRKTMDQGSVELAGGNTFTMPAEAVTVTVNWTGNSTSYTVNHWLLNLDGTRLGSPTATETLYAEVDSYVYPERLKKTTPEYEGFYLKNTTGVRINGGGTTVVDIEYSHGLYGFTITGQGDNHEVTTNVPATGYGGSYFYGSTVTIDPGRHVGTPVITVNKSDDTSKVVTVTMNGSVGSFVMPAYPVKATITWTLADVGYTVKHYQQNLNDSNYTLVAADTQALPGLESELTAATAKTYPGFTAQTFTQETIAGDGTTVVEIKYTRNSYDVTLSGGGTGSAGAGTYKFGATVTIVPGTGLGTIGVTAMQGATPVTITNNTFQMPAGNVAVTVTFTPQTKNYTVRHHKQNTDGTNYTLVDADTQTLSGEEGQETVATAKTYTGFTAQTFTQKTIASDGTTVVDIYYDRIKYNVTVNGGEAGSGGAGDYMHGVTVTIEPGARQGGGIPTVTAKQGSTDVTVTNNSFTMPLGDVTVTITWRDASTFVVKWINPNGTVLETDNSVLEGAVPEFNGATPAMEADAQYTYGEFTGWTPEVVAATGATVYMATYNNKTTNNYTVTATVDYAGRGRVSQTSVAGVPFGTVITTDGNKLTVNGTTITATANSGYEFLCWKTGRSVSGDVTVTACFKYTTVDSGRVLIVGGSNASVYPANNKGLMDAFAAAENGDTIKLDADILYSELQTFQDGDGVEFKQGYTPWVKGSQSVILDLNGHTYTPATTIDGPLGYLIYVTGHLTIKDSSGTGKISSSYYVVVVEGGELELESGTIESKSSGACAVECVNTNYSSNGKEARFIMNGGKLLATEGCAILGYQYSMVVINDGEVEAVSGNNKSAISMGGDKDYAQTYLIANGGTITHGNTGSDPISVGGYNSQCSISGATIIGDNAAAYAIGHAFSCGKLEGVAGKVILSVPAEDAGYSYYYRVSSEYIPDLFTPVDLGSFTPFGAPVEIDSDLGSKYIEVIKVNKLGCIILEKYVIE